MVAGDAARVKEMEQIESSISMALCHKVYVLLQHSHFAFNIKVENVIFLIIFLLPAMPYASSCSVYNLDLRPVRHDLEQCVSKTYPNR